MEKNSKDVKNSIIIYMDKEIYPLITIKKAMYNYLDKAYIEASINKEKIEVKVSFFDSLIDRDWFIKEFKNDCLRESLRYDLLKETKNIRELILGRALYTSCIEVEEIKEDNKEESFEKIEDVDYDLDDIAINWFDKKGE